MSAVIVFYDEDRRIAAFAAMPRDPEAQPAGVRATEGIRSVQVELTPELERLPLMQLLTGFRLELEGEPALVPLHDRAAAGDEAAGEETEALPEATPTRYEALVLTASTQLQLADVADLDLDRLPDPEGRVRVLINVDEARDLADRGYEVRLMNALEVHPLDPSLVLSDEQAEAWLRERVAGVQREQES